MGVRVLSPLFKLVIEPEELGELIPNKGWESGDAGGWTFEDLGMILDVSTLNPRTGTYSLRFYTPYASTRWSRLRYSVTAKQLALLKGESVTFNMYKWYALTFPGGAGTYAYIRIDDGVGSTDSDLLTGTQSTYLPVSVTRTIDSTASKVEFIIYYYKAGGGRLYNIYTDDMDAFKN